jgi:hypothetical protein
MRLLVCGGRNYADRERLFELLDELHKRYAFSLLVNGGARGADKLARVWAHERDIPVRVFTANWARNGSLAGPLRNQRMLVEGRPELVVAFPGGPGTRDMTRQATKFGVAVRRVS